MALTAPETQFMCVRAVHEPPGKSFEEIRIEDYLRFYTTTGRPPPPCPQEPADAVLRERAGLPSLFKPYTERSLLTTTRPSDLPDAQNFYTTVHEGDIFHSISAIPTYEAFSHEELRYYAYLKGNRLPPTPVTPAPFVLGPPSADGMTPRPSNLPPGAEQMMTISAQAAYSGHSLEELRVAFMQAGRELTSSEILARGARNPAYPFAPSVSSGGGPFARPLGVRLF
ncbi:hypothetical protein LshimejAT787_0409390 [Lyophyllum shimeji]|uniref:Uncharacterized protein n=1 Tax=Lyophyllum shimeji TaxID=47721 RepID=A0A9P3PL27_LYOSH|nr:hypothetical protein LshimejAT787_0409390 [Lyophyllum shimeji]